MKKALVLLVALLSILLVFSSCDDRPGTSTGEETGTNTDDGGTESGTIYYTLTIKNGEETTTEKVKKGTEYTLPSPDGTSYFEGWAVDGDEDNLKKEGDKITITADTTITAIWDDTRCTIMIDYNYEGSEPLVIVVTKNEAIHEEPARPTRLGYSFQHWSTDKEGKDPYEFIPPFDFSENTTFYAQWKKGYNHGDTFTLGTYSSGTKETGLEWRVLSYDEENKRVLVISAVLLDVMAHADDTSSAYKWSKSRINAWLNSSEDDGFIKKYGLDDVPMASVEHKTEEGADKSTQPEETTSEKVFLLSKTEAEAYFENNNARKTYGIDSGTAAQGSTWWLRTPGNDASTVYYVNYDGGIGNNCPVNDWDTPSWKKKVRPAFWIDLSD